MNFNHDNEMWDWQDQYACIGQNSSIELSKCLLNGVNQNESSLSHMFGDETTPVKACGDLAYHVADYEATGKELEQCDEPSSQIKRRRMLQFETEAEDATFCSDAFLRSKETHDSLEDAMSEMSQWVAGFAERTSATSSECLDPSSEGWITDCFNDVDMDFSIEDIVSGTSDVQMEITDICNTPPEYDANAAKKHPVHTRGNVIFKGRKSYMRMPPKLASSVVKPFAFIKPCGVHGDVTLNDINQKIHTPPKSQQNNKDLSDSCLTSAFSGKPVVGRTKIHTEGGKGSITIMRTKG